MLHDLGGKLQKHVRVALTHHLTLPIVLMSICSKRVEVNVTSVNDGGPSGSVSEILSVPSEDEEELDDASLGIKTRKNPRAGIRRKLPPKTVPPKNKGRLRRGNYETLMASGDGPATSTAGSSAMSESSLSDSDSSSSNSSSNGLTENAVGSGSEVQVKAPIKAGDVQASRKDEDGQSKPEENDGAGLDVKERSQGRGKAGQESNGEQPKDDAHTPDEPAKVCRFDLGSVARRACVRLR